MKIRYYQISSVIYSLIFISLLFSCKDHKEDYHSIIDKIEAESKNYNGILMSSEDFLEDLKTIEIIEGEHTFLIPERKSKIKSYSCNECHTKPLQELQNAGNTKKAHWDINLSHADLNTMNCATCHSSNNMDNLISITGNSIDFNKSYQLCSQCHTKQFEDWKGGAHGKRLGGWVPPRASMTCVNCHDPHKPHFESRWPDRFNTQKVKERE